MAHDGTDAEVVFRRDGSRWRLVPRHADPLTHGINPELAAAVARGEHAS